MDPINAVIAYLFINKDKIKDKVVESHQKVQSKIVEHRQNAELEAERAEKERKEHYARQWKHVDQLITKHSEVLSRKRRDFSKVDDYGVSDLSKWEQEKTYFVGRIINTDSSAVSLPMNSEHLSTRIDTILDHLGM